jgi:drug/metabolite transporter (DMT)-like permease
VELLKRISVFASNLTINLEPVYGIILAYFLLDEHKQLTSGFYWGTLTIISAVFIYPLLKKFDKEEPKIQP